jgi:sec-independent protein translocase protein TatB
MLTDLSSWHIFILLIAALVFIGPKDLPKFLHKVGKFVGKMRGMANEFRASFDEMARQSELDELRKEVEAMRKASQAALPVDLGIEATMKSDAEAAYLANWEASHAAPTDTSAVANEPTILPPAPSLEPAAEAAPKKPRAPRAKPPADSDAVQKPPAKPRAPRKPKPEAEA